MRGRVQVIFLVGFSLVAHLFASPAAGQSSFVNYEASLVKPLVVSGNQLLAIHNEEDRLVVYDLDNGNAILDEIPLGLEPVSLRVRPGHEDEVWVVNSLSDNVNVVDLTLGMVVATIHVGDEPADIEFTADGSKAYVSIGEEDKIVVLDATTRAITRTIPLFGASPRSISRTPNGKFMIVSIFKSSNDTTVIPFDHPEAPQTTPRVGHIVAGDDSRAPVQLADNDVFAIRTSNDTVLPRTLQGLGTILFSHAIHPGNGKLYVTNTEALNLVQYEPELRGHFVDNRVSIVEKNGPSLATNLVDLNLHVDYDVMPSPAAIPLSLAQPTDIAIDRKSGKVYVAAYGSGLVGVLDEDGSVVSRIAVGGGPRGLALRRKTNRLYCLNRFDHSISEIDTQSGAVVSTFDLGSYDPTPDVIRQGREVLYDATLSGNGTNSCATCHVDGDTDMLSWDLGDPNGGIVQGPPGQPGIEFASAKGPMTTQTLRGLKGTGALHWRGDRPTFVDFNPAFDGLMGRGSEIPENDMKAFSDFVDTINFMPNPNQNPNRTLSDDGQSGFNSFRSTAPFFGVTSCMTCHTLPFGSNPDIIPQELLAPISQDFKAGKLTATYHKEGRFDKVGFGVSHDGAIEDLFGFFSFTPPFPRFSRTLKERFVQFVVEFDTGTAPAVGREFVVNQANATDAETRVAITDLMTEVARVHCDLIVHGTFRSQRHGLFYNVRSGFFVADDSRMGKISLDNLLDEAAAGNAFFVVKGVPVGSGSRMAIDRDNDCLPDLDELRLGTSPTDPDSDQDNWLDGWEVLEGSVPSDGTSVPQSLTAPVIQGAFTANYRPYGAVLARIKLSATGVLPGAELEATAPNGDTFTYNIFPTGPDEWSIYDPVQKTEVQNDASGWTFVIRNKTGASSPAFEAP